MPSLPKVASEKSEAALASEDSAETPVIPPKKIKVVALAKGFFAQDRKVEGDEFEVSSMKQLGSWMKCVDPTIQKMHEEAMRQKKKRKVEAADE